MGGSPRPMEPMGPHRPRALKYTPTGGSSRPIGQGPSAKAHGAHGAPYGHVFLDLVFLAQSRPSWGVNPSTPWPPGGFRPNLCSTKIASRASQGRSGHPVPVYTNLQFYKISIFSILFFDPGSILDPSYICFLLKTMKNMKNIFNNFIFFIFYF